MQYVANIDIVRHILWKNYSEEYKSFGRFIQYDRTPYFCKVIIT